MLKKTFQNKMDAIRKSAIVASPFPLADKAARFVESAKSKGMEVTREKGGKELNAGYKPLPKIKMTVKMEKSPKEKYWEKKEKSSGIGVGY